MLMLVLKNDIREAVSYVAVPSIIGRKGRSCERFEKDGTQGGMVSWFGTCRGRVKTTVRGTALIARQEGRRGQAEEASAETVGTRKEKGVEKGIPSILGREDMAEQE